MKNNEASSEYYKQIADHCVERTQAARRVQRKQLRERYLTKYYIPAGTSIERTCGDGWEKFITTATVYYEFSDVAGVVHQGSDKWELRPKVEEQLNTNIGFNLFHNEIPDQFAYRYVIFALPVLETKRGDYHHIRVPPNDVQLARCLKT